MTYTRRERIGMRIYGTACFVMVAAFIVAVAAVHLFHAPAVARVAKLIAASGLATCFLVGAVAVLSMVWGDE